MENKIFNENNTDTLNRMEEYHKYKVRKLNKLAVKKLPEYNEILYHARTLTDEQFREYWNDVQNDKPDVKKKVSCTYCRYYPIKFIQYCNDCFNFEKFEEAY